jgi:hypothetical protein
MSALCHHRRLILYVTREQLVSPSFRSRQATRDDRGWTLGDWLTGAYPVVGTVTLLAPCGALLIAELGSSAFQVDPVLRRLDLSIISE